jgi:predicted enzyme related to lactoylglutathione lyase
MKLASIRLTTRDVPALAKFYEKLSGVAPSSHPSFPGYAEIRFQGFTIALARGERGEVQRGAAVAAANRSVILEFEVADVDAERARLGGLVTEWVMEPTDMPWGNRSMLFRDPDGTLINLYKPAR